MTLRGWLLGNLFLLAIPCTGAGLLFLCAWCLNQIPLGPDFDPFTFALATLATIFGTYYLMAYAHRLIERRLNRAR